ncbi:MAG: tetratricopeptide repeat protein [Anaerolineae bacterium]
MPEGDPEAEYALRMARWRAYQQWGPDIAVNVTDLPVLMRLADELGDPQRKAEVMRLKAEQAFAAQDVEAGIAATEKAIALARANDDPHAEALANYRLGTHLAFRTGQDADAAQAYVERGVALARAHGFRALEARILRRLTLILTYRDKYAPAKEAGERALELWRDLGNRLEEGRVLNVLADVALGRSNYQEARRYALQGLKLAKETGNQYDAAWVTSTLSLALLGLGEYTEARSVAERAVVALREAGVLEHWGFVALCRADCYLGDHEAAKAHAQRALDRHLDSETFGESWALSTLGMVAHREGDDPTARDYSRQAVALSTVGVRRRYHMPVLGYALSGLGELDEAREVFEEAIALWRELDLPSRASESLAGLAQIALRRGEPARALDLVERILEHLGDAGALCDAWEPFQVHLTCARVLRANGDPRADDVLTNAYRDLQARAAKIDDQELRRSYLRNVPAHRETVAEYTRREGGASESE